MKCFENERVLNNCKKALGYRISELRKKVINPETNKQISQEELGMRKRQLVN